MKRWLILLAVVVLLAAAAGAMLLTTTGLQWVAGMAAPASVEYTSLEGRLIGPVEVTGLRWQHGGQRLDIASAAIDWKLAPLFARQVHITSVTAQGVRWQSASDTSTTPAAARTPGLPQLPVSIVVDALRVGDIRIEQDDNAFVIDLLQLSAALDTDKYSVEKLDLQSPWLDLTGGAAVGVAAPHSVTAGLSFGLTLGEDPIRIAGRLGAQGDTDALQLELSTEDALVANLTGTATRLLSTPGFEGALKVTRIEPRLTGLADDRVALTLSGSASPDGLQIEGLVDVPSLTPRAVTVTTTVRLDGNRIAVDTLLDAPSLAPHPLTVASSISMDGDLITIETLKAGLVDTPTKLALTGSLQRDLSAFDVALNWQKIAWPLTGAPTVASPDGRATLSGAIDNYALDLTATASTPDWPDAQIAVKGAGTRERFTIASATVRPGDEGASEKGGGERLLASGMIEWQASVAANLKFNAHNLRLERLHPQLAGRLSADGQAQISLLPGGAEVSASIRDIGGQLRGQQLGGSGAVTIVPGNIAVRDVNLVVGNAAISAAGTIADQIDLRWDINIPDLALLWPPYGGAINTSGRATGPASRPALLGTIDVRALDAAPVAIERLTGRFDVGLDPQASADIQLDGKGVRVNELQVGKMAATATGTIAAQVIRVEIDGPAGKLAAQFDGGLAANIWQGQLAALRAERADVGAWQLRDAAGLQIETQRFSVDNACLDQQASSVCIDGTLARAAPGQADFRVVALPVALFAALLPPGLQFEGNIDGDGFIAMADGGYNGAASLAFAAGRVISREGGEDNIVLGYDNGRLQTRFDAAALQVETHFDLRNDGVIEADFRAPLQGTRALDGKVRVRLENLSLVPALVPQIGRIDGRIQADLDLTGTLDAPETSGKIRVDASEMVLPDFGITLTQSQLDIATVANELSFNGQATSGEGSLNLEGTLRWYEGAPVGKLKLSGENFRAVDLPEVRIDASPQVTVSVTKGEIALAGEVIVPSANITPLNIATGVGVSPDQIIVDQAVTESADDRWQIDATLRVTAGDAVQISGFGLQGRLTGSVLIVQQPDQPATGRGTLEVVDGRYRAYGQELAINTGRLEFTGGPIDDPALDLRASRTSGEIEAGVQVRGALRKPVLTLYSSPPLSDTQTLSYLVTGRGVEQLDEAGQTAVSDAATRLALQGGGTLLANSVGRGLGLDTVAFEDEGTTASTALVVGKQLSPRLFVSYGIGLFEAINTLRLRYRINSRLTLQTESGIGTSADLLYSFDR